MEKYNLEFIYDSEISPLIQQVIAVCKKHKIPMIASFTYENCEEKGRGRCTTHLGFDGRRDETNEKANHTIKHGDHSTMNIITRQGTQQNKR